MTEAKPTTKTKPRGSGFEEFFADSPLTPAEAKEEKEDVYSPKLSVEEYTSRNLFLVYHLLTIKPRRLQNCIQRFRARRRLNNDLALYFNEYLFLGGIDTNPHIFSSRDAKVLKDMDLTPAEKRDITATDVIYTSPIMAGEKFYGGEREMEDENGDKVTTWSVDFTGVVAGFLSNNAAQLTGLDEERLGDCIGVVENFLKYVLQHDVCPEYAKDVETAIKICGKAREEWPMILRLEAALPGQFNLAAAQVLGFHEEGDWAMVPEFESQEEARDAFQGVFHATCRGVDESSLRDHATVQEDRHLELLDIRGDGVKGMKALVFKPTVIEDGWDHPVGSIDDDLVVLQFERHITEHMRVGMKMSVTLVHLEVGGLTILKSLKEIVPSFHVFLPQTLMEGWKAPRPVQKPPPSVHDALQEA